MSERTIGFHEPINPAQIIEDSKKAAKNAAISAGHQAVTVFEQGGTLAGEPLASLQESRSLLSPGEIHANNWVSQTRFSRFINFFRSSPPKVEDPISNGVAFLDNKPASEIPGVFRIKSDIEAEFLDSQIEPSPEALKRIEKKLNGHSEPISSPDSDTSL